MGCDNCHCCRVIGPGSLTASKRCPEFKDGSVCLKNEGHYGDHQSFAEWLDEKQAEFNAWTLGRPA